MGGCVMPGTPSAALCSAIPCQWMEVSSGSSLVISIWSTSPAVASMAGSPESAMYPQVLASMPPISIDIGRAVSVLRNVGSDRLVGDGRGAEDEDTAAGELVPLPQAARAPLPASMRPPRRSCRREKPCDTGEGPFWKREIEGGYVRRRSVTQVAPSSAVENSVVPV